MPKATKITIDIKKLQALQKRLQEINGAIDSKTAKKLGNNVVKEMKSLISKGISPVKSSRFKARFPGYKNPRRYPGDRKQKRPVNLRLTGQMLKALDSKVKKDGRNYTSVIGYFDDEAAQKELGHRKGTNKQLKRPTIPLGSAQENWAARINKIILQTYNDAIKKITGKKL